MVRFAAIQGPVRRGGRARCGDRLRGAPEVEAEGHESDEGFRIRGDIAADAHPAELDLLARSVQPVWRENFGDRFVERLAVESEHVLCKLRRRGMISAAMATTCAVFIQYDLFVDDGGDRLG